MISRSYPGTYMHPDLNTGERFHPSASPEEYARLLEGLRLLRADVPAPSPAMPVRVGKFDWWRNNIDTE